MQLKGTKPEESLKAAFADVSKADRCYLYFANMADIEGAPEVATVFRYIAEGETGHTHSHMEHFIQNGLDDPEIGLASGNIAEALGSAITGGTYDYTDIYPGIEKAARKEGFDEIADWFETLAKTGRSDASRFHKPPTPSKW